MTPHEVNLSSADRVLFPDSGITNLANNGNDSPFLTAFPYFAPAHPRPGDEGQ